MIVFQQVPGNDYTARVVGPADAWGIMGDAETS